MRTRDRCEKVFLDVESDVLAFFGMLTMDRCSVKKLVNFDQSRDAVEICA
jgi:hypothetical protein